MASRPRKRASTCGGAAVGELAERSEALRMPVEVREAVTAYDRAQAFDVRRAVFVEELRVPEDLERDELDDVARHVIALDDEGACVGTGRLVLHPLVAGRVGRMAVHPAWRRRGVGSRILEAIEAIARAQGTAEVELHAQCQVEAFYRNRGYRPEGEVFLEAGIEHILMRKRL